MAYGEIYTVVFEAVAATAVQDLFEINAAAGKPLRVHALMLSQHTEVGDAQSELLRFKVIRAHSTSGSGGSAPTPAPLNPSAAASSFTAEVNNTTQATGGSPITLHADTWNVQAGLALILPPELHWVVPGGGRLVVAMSTTAPADSITLSGTLYVEEIG